MAVASLVISLAALLVAMVAAFVQLRVSRQANDLPVLVELFSEHRTKRLSDARTFVFRELNGFDLTRGLAGLPEDKRDLVRDLAWYYDNLGVLVTHGHIDLAPVSGYLGVAASNVWRALEPLINAERVARAGSGDPRRWQEYFENLVCLVQELPPDRARREQRRWRVR
jgi:hypothetical protein